jgi:hypothetical protein
MSYQIQLSRAQILAICTALEQCPPPVTQEQADDSVAAFELHSLKLMFENTLNEPEGDKVLHVFTV